MIYFGNLKKKLKKIAIRQIIISLFFIPLFFAASFFVYTTLTSYLNTQKSLEQVNELFLKVYEENRSFLSFDKIDNPSLESISDPGNFQSLENSLNRLNASSIAKTDVIILNEDFDINYSTFSNERETDLRINYTRAISNKVKGKSEESIYNSVYKGSRGFPDLMMTRKITSSTGNAGYITMFVSGYDWSYYMLSNLKNDSVITDLEGNIIFYSKPSLLENNYKFTADKFKTKINDNNYSVLSESLEDQGIMIYALNVRTANNTLLYSFFFIILIGFIWYRYSKRIANVVIEDNIQSINDLVGQINLISDTSKNKRINLDTNDEYEYVALNINSMLNRIDSLNERNTALIKLNNTIEIKQLLSQYNPHFLYNTLEIIRSSFHWDPQKSDRLIIKLTNILKYSIDGTKKDVTLREDMKYINDYLDIQKIRFEDRFNYKIDVSPEAAESVVIKLLLQPVIENSIKYGFQAKREVNLCIQAHIVDDELTLRVKDDGPGMSESKIKTINTMKQTEEFDQGSLGLYNIARRLHLQYSKDSGIKIWNNEGAGITVEIKVSQKK